MSRLKFLGGGGRDWQGKHATAVEEMDGTMADCGGGGAGAGWRMAEAGTLGKGLEQC